MHSVASHVVYIGIEFKMRFTQTLDKLTLFFLQFNADIEVNVIESIGLTVETLLVMRVAILLN